MFFSRPKQRCWSDKRKNDTGKENELKLSFGKIDRIDTAITSDRQRLRSQIKYGKKWIRNKQRETAFNNNPKEKTSENKY